MPGTPPAPRNELVSLLQKLEDEVFFAVLDVALDVENELITGAQPVFVAIRRIAVRYTILCPINSVGAVDRYCELRWKALTFLKKYDLISSFTHREQGGHRWEGVVEVTVQDLVRYTELLVQLRIEENRRNTGQELEPEIADAPAGLTQHTTQFGPVVFISHSSKDADLALALVDLLKAAFHLTADQIRCSSVDGYRLPVGVNTESKLREEVNAAKVVVGLITPSALVSYYVMFELGARWGAGLFLAPLLAGVKASDLQGPIALLNALSADNETQLHQLIQDISPQLKLTSQPPASYHRYVCTVSNGAAAVKPAILSVPSESLPIDAKSPQLILDFEPEVDDSPRRRKRNLILRNVGSEIAVNITVEPFSIGDTLITCDVIDRLLPNGDTARLTSEMRREDDVRKPCLVGLDQLFQFELLPKRQSEQPPTPISLGFEDLIGRRYRISYLARYQQGINECKLEYKALARMN